MEEKLPDLTAVTSEDFHKFEGQLEVSQKDWKVSIMVRTFSGRWKYHYIEMLLVLVIILILKYYLLLGYYIARNGGTCPISYSGIQTRSEKRLLEVF